MALAGAPTWRQYGANDLLRITVGAALVAARRSLCASRRIAIVEVHTRAVSDEDPSRPLPHGCTLLTPSGLLHHSNYVPYSITSSARPSSVIGNVRPSVLAIFML